jgi:hypothetical protein
MVLCAACNVNNIDRHCTNTPRTCYRCCSTSPTILTCPYHFSIMGNTEREARLLTGQVHPHILADAAEGDIQVDDPAAAPDPPHLPVVVVALPNPAPQDDPAAAAAAVVVHVDPIPPVPGGAPPAVAQPPPGPDHAALVASVASLTTLVQQLVQAEAARQAAAAALASAPAAPPAPPRTESPLPFVPLPQPPAPVSDIPVLISPPPHRAAVLDRAAASAQSDIAALVNRFSALPVDGDSDDEDTTVKPQPHTHNARTPQSTQAGVLPAAFVPPPIGSENSATQQLAAIFSALNKQGGKVKYSTIEELDEALDDWAADAVKSGRSAQQVESIRAYQRLLIKQFAISDRMPLKQVLEYHRLWCKAVNNGSIDLFSPGAAMNHNIYYEVTHPFRLSGQGSSSSSSSTKDGKSKGAADKTKKPAIKHALGACTYHPTSTSHTTAECIKKGGQ